MLIVTLKYVLVLLNADNKGEGGTFALMALGQSVATAQLGAYPDAGRGGASFFYGDAVITPAISVLSAVEGLKLVAPQMDVVVLADHGWPSSCCCLPCNRAARRRWRNFFGPIMLVWFVALAVGGLIHIVDDRARVSRPQSRCSASNS